MIDKNKKEYTDEQIFSFITGKEFKKEDHKDVVILSKSIQNLSKVIGEISKNDLELKINLCTAVNALISPLSSKEKQASILLFCLSHLGDINKMLAQYEKFKSM